MNTDRLHERIELLGTIAHDATGRLNTVVVDRASQLHGTATARLGHGSGHTVVALAGSTGSGKSSLFNVLSGTEVSTVGVRRPTTAAPFAAVFGDGADALLQWLEVPNRTRLAPDVAGTDLNGLVLLDLPDHDSVWAANRREVDRLVQVVDQFVWVVDPQKYADASLHDGYLRMFAHHGAVTIVVLNQIDRLTPHERTSCIDDLGRLLVADGLAGVRVLACSATTGEGTAELRRELSARTAERQALLRRILADLDWVAADLATAIGDSTVTAISPEARDAVVAAASQAAGRAQIETAVDVAYRHRAAIAVGWPPLRWTRRLKLDPLQRLGLRTTSDTRTRSGVQSTENNGIVRRTSIRVDPVAQGRLGEAVRALARNAVNTLPDAPRAAVVARVHAADSVLPDLLDAAAGRTDLHVDPPRWWAAAAGAQRVVTAAMAAGLAWLAVLVVLGWFRIPDPPLPRIGRIPLPTLLALGGAAIGLTIAAIGRRAAASGAARRAKRAGRQLQREVANTIDTALIAPVNAELAAITDLAARIRSLAR